MKKIILILTAIIILIYMFFYFKKLSQQEETASIIRKLSSLRLSLALYQLKEKKLPLDFNDVIKKGYLEEIPKIKLKWEKEKNKVINTSSIKIENTGCFRYINNSKDKDFGLIYIDSIKQDEEKRYWSWF